MTSAFLESRLGRVFISAQAMEDASSELRLLFVNFLPISAQYDESTDSYEYVGYSEKFTALAIENPIPTYEPLFKAELDLLSNERIVGFLGFRR